MVYSADKLPNAFPTWREYRDYLLSSAPIAPNRKERFIKRFAEQDQDEYVYRQQCRQILPYSQSHPLLFRHSYNLL